jgi:hypothetical protein
LRVPEVRCVNASLILFAKIAGVVTALIAVAGTCGEIAAVAGVCQ